MAFTFAPGQKPWVDQFQMTPEQAAQQAAQQKARDERDSATQAAQTAQNLASARQQGLAGEAFTTGTGATSDVANTVGGYKTSMQDPTKAWANFNAQAGMVAKDSAAKDAAKIAAAPSFNAAPAATSGPSGFKSFSGENAVPYTGKPIPTVGSQPNGGFSGGVPLPPRPLQVQPNGSQMYRPTDADFAEGGKFYNPGTQARNPGMGSQPQGTFNPQNFRSAKEWETAMSGGGAYGGGNTLAEQGAAQQAQYFGRPIPQIPTQPQVTVSAPPASGTPVPYAGTRSEGWLNTGPAMPTGGSNMDKVAAMTPEERNAYFANTFGGPKDGSRPPQDMSGMLKPTGGFTMPAGGMSLPTTSVPGSYAPQIAVPQFNAYGGSTSQGTQINPNDTLRTQQFLPGSTQNPYDQQAIAALNAVQGANTQNPYDAQAAGMYGGANMPTEFSPMVGESRDMIMNRLRELSGPDRTQLAQEAYDIFRQQSEPGYQQDLRGVGQKAAALGRVGAGMTTNDLTGVLGQREQQQNLLKRSLINDAGQQTLQDRINTLNATMGGSSTLEGQDFGRQSAAANLAMGKAAGFAGLGQNQYNREYNNSQLGMQKAGFLQGMGSEEFNRGQQNYNQNANERAYQDYLARTALEDRVRQQEMQQQQAQQEWQNQYQANALAATLAAQQNTGYPSIAQPQGDSFAAGQQAGAGTPTYQGSAQSFYEPSVQEPWTPPPSNPGLGMQDPASWGRAGPNIFNPNYDTPTFGNQPNSWETPLFARQRFGLE